MTDVQQDQPARDALLALAERCEAATGADRALDRKIWYALQDIMTGDPAHGPRFTASLDAASTLVLKRWRWMAGHREHPHARAYVENGELAFIGGGMRRNLKRQWFEATADNPPLALCAAALRARASTLP